MRSDELAKLLSFTLVWCSEIFVHFEERKARQLNAGFTKWGMEFISLSLAQMLFSEHPFEGSARDEIAQF